jgi:hypothetical protein
VRWFATFSEKSPTRRVSAKISGGRSCAPDSRRRCTSGPASRIHSSPGLKMRGGATKIADCRLPIADSQPKARVKLRHRFAIFLRVFKTRNKPSSRRTSARLRAARDCGRGRSVVAPWGRRQEALLVRGGFNPSDASSATGWSNCHRFGRARSFSKFRHDLAAQAVQFAHRQHALRRTKSFSSAPSLNGVPPSRPSCSRNFSLVSGSFSACASGIADRAGAMLPPRRGDQRQRLPTWP